MMLQPHDLNFPESISSFRDCQQEAFEYCLTSDKQYCALGMPPGSGKSAIAYGLARLFGGRTIILTATHGLEEQYISDLNGNDDSDNKTIRLSHIRGRRNYSCWEGGNCDDGRRAGCNDKIGCPYLARLRAFNAGDVGITNYAWWLSAVEYMAPDSQPDTLICDEAHLIPEWLSNSLNFRLTEKELHVLGYKQKPSEDVDEWLQLAPRLLEIAYSRYEMAKAHFASNKFRSTDDVYKVRKAEELYDKCNKLNSIGRFKDNWIVSRIEGADDGRSWRFDVIWPGMYKQRLFQGVKRVILMSATLRPKTLQLIGLKRDEVDFKEWVRQFPAVNGPVIWIPTVKMKHDMDGEDIRKWLDTHEKIYEWGKDRKGISHTVSYSRAKQIDDALGRKFVLFLNGAADPESAKARDAFEKFIRDDRNGVLVSPSFSTGWDFRGDRAEWQTISKIAFPPKNDRLIMARTDQDREYPAYCAVQDLVQASGRLTRFYDDRGMTIIIDDQVGKPWFKHAIKEHAPKWFNVRREDELPKPLEKL